MIDRNRFINQWKKEFGCQCDSSICWCDASIKLGFLYDWLLKEIGNSIWAYVVSHIDEGKVEDGTIGAENLPSFMNYRKVK